LRQIQFDPQYGKLLLAQDKDTVKLFSVNNHQELDFFQTSRLKNFTSSSFFPFREEHASPGVIVLPQNSSNFIYLQVEEGMGRIADF
jgi:hypothetical protein